MVPQPGLSTRPSDQFATPARRRTVLLSILASLCVAVTSTAGAATITYGDLDVLNQLSYGTDPRAGATREGLAPDVVTVATQEFGHTYPFAPEIDDFAGTDQIYVGSSQTGSNDGYSGYSGRIAGPQVIFLDYSSIILTGHVIDTLTLGIAADDFQFPTFGNPFSALINGSAATALTTQLNTLNQTGPDVQFFSIGIDPAILAVDHILVLSIDQGGIGGDGWAIDFLEVGVTSSLVPEPSTALLLGIGLTALGMRRRCNTPRP